MIRLVVFDISGTTLHDDDAVNTCLAEALKEGGRWLKREVINQVMGVSKRQAIDLLLEPLASDAGADAIAARKARIDSIYRDFSNRIIVHYDKSSSVREIDGASDTFKALKLAKVRVALDTGFDRRIANAVLRRTRWIALGLVDATVTSDEVVQGRPAPDMIFRAMTLTGVNHASDVVKVGDTPADLLEGTNAGCRLVVGYTSGTHTHDQLAEAPHTHLIADLRDLLPIVGIQQRGHARAQ